MSQMSFSDFEYAGKRKQTRRERFLAEMGSGRALEWLAGAHRAVLPEGRRRPKTLSAGNQAAHPSVAELVLPKRSGHGRSALRNPLHAPVRTPNAEHTDPRRHHNHELRASAGKHQLAPAILAVINGYLQEKGLSLRQGTIVDATIIHAPSSTKNEDRKRDPEMHQTKKGNQYFFGMKAHISADAESGLVHHVHGTAANVADVTQVAELLHGEENAVHADAGCSGVEEHENREVI